MITPPKPTDGPATSIRIAELVGQIGQSVRAARLASDLTPVQWEALRYLGSGPGRHPSGLADRLGLTRGAASQTVAALARLGLVLRLPDPRDGRSLALDLTNAGRRMVQSDPLLTVAHAMAALPAPTVAATEAALTAVLAAMPVARGSPGRGPAIRGKRRPSGQARV